MAKKPQNLALTILSLRIALERIANHETRANRKGKRLVDIDEIETLRRIARNALAQP